MIGFKMPTPYYPYDRTPGPKGCKGKNKDGSPCERMAFKGGFCKVCTPFLKRPVKPKNRKFLPK